MNHPPLLRDVTRLKVVHRQRVNRQGDADPAPLFAAANLAPDVLGSAVDGWQRLLETEHESIVISAWMTSALARLGAPLDLVGTFGRVVEDEIRHVDLCAQMVDTFGGSPRVPVAPAPPFPSSQATERQAQLEIIGGMVSFFCVFEHLSALVFAQAREAATEPKAGWAIGEIYRDEAFHGAFGFETAKYYVPTWEPDEKLALAVRVAGDIQRFEARLRSQEASCAAARPDAIRSLEQLGLLSTDVLLATFQAGVARELVPRLAELEIPIAECLGYVACSSTQTP